ncbi:MAG TPA: DNA methyltransferase, partial [Flavobacterium sp.]|uniref:DNA methyltransferase n=1 Tax=Flavobacterium sp. TaxID=239 RepID=UPI002ED2A465
DHPTQKPMALCDRLVLHFSNPDDLVFIPFGGSGSECVSSMKNARRFLATEINTKYIEIANLRLNEYREVNLKHTISLDR